MKRMLALLLALLSMGQASAESLAQRVGAQARVSDTLTSNTGKTIITVDAAVEVPDASSVNVYEVTVEEIPAERLVAFANEWMGEGQWQGDTAYGSAEDADVGGMVAGVTTESLLIESRETDYRGWAIDTIAAYRYRQNGQLRGTQAMTLTSRRNLLFNYNYFIMHQRGEADAMGCAYTRQEAISLAKEAAAVLAPELTEVYCGVINQGGDAVNYSNADEAYLVCFTRNVDGIPVTWTMLECTAQDEDKNGDPIVYRMPFDYESLRLVVTNEGITAGRYESPYSLGSVLQEDVQLLSLEQIMNVAKTILPLKYTWLEGSYQVKMKIDRITLGYTRVDFKDDMNRFMLVPVWDFFGTYECLVDGQAVTSAVEGGNSLLTINAMDGTVIDRNYGY